MVADDDEEVIADLTELQVPTLTVQKEPRCGRVRAGAGEPREMFQDRREGPPRPFFWGEREGATHVTRNHKYLPVCILGEEWGGTLTQRTFFVFFSHAERANIYKIVHKMCTVLYAFCL